jgi:hypothetical protein
MQINKEDFPMYVLCILLGSGGGTLGGRFMDNDAASIQAAEQLSKQKEAAQWKQIEENEDRIESLLLRECNGN